MSYYIEIAELNRTLDIGSFTRLDAAGVRADTVAMQNVRWADYWH